MEMFGYHPVRFTAGLRKNDTNNIILTLVVENFCIKYMSEVNSEHFLNALQKKLYYSW